MTATREIRITADAEFRIVRDQEGGPRIVGYAAVFDKPSVDYGGFYETIAPGAFTKALTNAPDVRCLFNHDPNLILARTPKTLSLSQDDRGLKFAAILADTQVARDLMVSIERDDITQCSFAFSMEHGGDVMEPGAAPSDPWHRTIKTVTQLFDVSPVTYPAYPDTTVAMRSLTAARDRAQMELARAQLRALEAAIRQS